MLSRNLEQTLHRALAHANKRNHEYGTLEHLLLALTDDQDAVAVLRACGVDIDRLKRDVSAYLDNELAGWSPAGPRTPSPPPASSACCSARSCMCNPAAARK